MAWANADGYKDFGWQDQTECALGVQNKPPDKLPLHASWNYGKSSI
jgi:long-chain fatty acid transport protein